MSESDEIKHTFICGITGSGKTVYARKWFENTDKRAIFVNTTEDLETMKAADVIVKKPEDVVKAFRDGKRKVCYNCGKNRDLTQIRDFMFQVGLEVNKADIAHIFDVFVDEAHDNWDGIEDLSTRGRRHGVQLITISQHPAVMTRRYENTVLTQVQNHVIFELGTYSKPYLDKYAIPYREHQSWLGKINGQFSHRFIEFDGVTVTRYNPLKL